jgi:hypothetical protein
VAILMRARKILEHTRIFQMCSISVFSTFLPIDVRGVGAVTESFLKSRYFTTLVGNALYHNTRLTKN